MVLQFCPEYYIISGTKLRGDIMQSSYSEKIKQRIENSPPGTIFINSDFTDIAKTETIRRNLNRLTQAGVLHHILNGIYEKPKYSKLLKEYVAVDPNKVAMAIARNYHWTIAPCGDTALNLLGLSAQVTAVWSYISDGPYRKYEWNNVCIEFKHRTNKEISGLSYMTRLIIQALKTLGKENISTEVIVMLSNRLTSEEKATVLKESAESTDWIYNIIRKICGVDKK